MAGLDLSGLSFSPDLRQSLQSTVDDDHTVVADIKALPIDDRLGSLRAHLAEPERTSSPKSYLLVKLPNLLGRATFEHKLELINEVLETQDKSHCRRILPAILKSSRDLEELALLVNSAGVEKLTRLKGGELQELVAMAVIGPELSLAHLPKTLSKFTPTEPARRTLSEIKACLLERLATCMQHEEFAETRTAKEFMVSVYYNLYYLQEERKLAKSAKQVRELANMLIDKIKLESSYCLWFSNETDERDRICRRWTSQDMQDIKKMLAAMPENKILFTPLLFRIERSNLVQEEAYAERDSDGVIRVADSTIANQGLKKRCRGVSSLASTLCHEMGHSIQIGARTSLYSPLQIHGQAIKGSADPSYDFEKYLELSGWTTYPKGDYRFKDGGLSVVLNGKECQLHVPIVYEGKNVIMKYDSSEKRLFSYPIEAQFSVGTYCRSSPWEDWAEAFSEYILIPKRLIDFAPKKFEYFEEHFGKYADNKRISEYLAKKGSEVSLPPSR